MTDISQKQGGWTPGQERDAFEAWYCADAAQHGFSFIAADMADLREGDSYGDGRIALNSKWEGWQARAALARANPSTDQGGE